MNKKSEFFGGRRVIKAIKKGHFKGQRGHRLQAIAQQQATHEDPNERRRIDHSW